MQNNLASRLYALQSYEHAVDRARARIEEIDELLSGNEVVAQQQAILDDSQTQLQHLEGQQQNLELEIASLREKITEVDQLLYSGRITNPKDLQQRQDELASLQRREENLNAQLGDVRSTVGETRTVVQDNKTTLASVIEAQEINQAELVTEREALDTEVKKNLKKRKKMVADVPSDVLKTYKQLRKKRHGQAVALLQGHQCTACGIEQTSTIIQDIMSGDELIYCIGCKRILTIS